MAKSNKQRSQGGGRTPNSEPRLQVFRDFSGCNFQLSPREFTLGAVSNGDEMQSDLQMNYVVLQDNAEITDNKTIETRNNIVKLFDAPEGKKFTDASILVGKDLFIGLDDGSLVYSDVDNPSYDFDQEVLFDNQTGSEHHWQSLAYADNKLIATTAENQLWTSLESDLYTLQNAVKITDPTESNGYGPLPNLSNLSKRGSLEIRDENHSDDTHYARIVIAWSFVNKYGPTKISNKLTFYANTPVNEWHAGCFLNLHGPIPQNQGVEAVEIYYSVGNAQTMLFAGRTDVQSTDISWSFDWFGYLDSTSMWPMANLLAPTENVTEGVKASHVVCIDSRLYFWGNQNNPQRLWIGGNSGNLFSISPGTGGGFVDVEPGSGQEIRSVMKYKTQSGNSIVTMLCDSKNSSNEQRFNLVENSVTISNEQNMKSWQAEQVAGAVGCKSFHGAKVCEDGLYSVSRYGLALTTMTMEYNSQIRTTYVSDPIKPVFTDKLGNLLKSSVMLERDGVIYVAFGRGNDAIDNILFCYDIDLKAWWTISLGIEEKIIDMLYIDYEGFREGIGIVTEDEIYLLPLTHNDSPTVEADFNVLIQTGELSTQQPQQGWFYLSQMEFRFDYFIGDIEIDLTGIDQFGRKVSTKKHISHSETQYNLAEYMRVDLRLQSYRIRITGQARFRMTHFISKLYTMSNKQGIVWGFDDSMSHNSAGDIHPTFKDYNDIRDAIIP